MYQIGTALAVAGLPDTEKGRAVLRSWRVLDLDVPSQDPDDSGPGYFRADLVRIRFAAHLVDVGLTAAVAVHLANEIVRTADTAPLFEKTVAAHNHVVVCTRCDRCRKWHVETADVNDNPLVVTPMMVDKSVKVAFHLSPFVHDVAAKLADLDLARVVAENAA